MRIRKGVLRDASHIGALYEELFEDIAVFQPLILQSAEQDEVFIRKQILSPMADFYVMETEMVVIGFALIAESEAPPYNEFIHQSYGYIVDVVVAHEFRGQGIGTQLLKECVSWSKERELSYIEINVLEGNDKAKSLYEKMGFRNSMVSMIQSL